MQGHEALKTLELGYNPLGPEGAQMVADVAKFELKVRCRMRMVCVRMCYCVTP